MIRTTLNWTVKNLKAMKDEKDTLSFNHPIQRQSAQWTNEQQSLLIHSMLDNFPVPSVYIHKTESVEVDAKGRHSYGYSVLDGKQRMTTVFSYIDGEYALADDTPDVTIEDTVYEIAGKYFDDLDEDVQQEILRFKFNIQAFEDVTDEVIEEIFFRLNNSTPLTKPQKAKPLMGVNNSIFINEILTNRFFTEKCNFTKRQLTQSADLCTLLQGMMLLDNKYRGYDFPNISDDEAMVYSKWINGNYPDECRCKVKKIVAFLDNIFYMKDKNLRKINIPVLFLMADKALSMSISGTNFRRWYCNFFEKHKDEYGQFCSSGSIKKEKTMGRIEVMERYFDEYFRAEVDEATEQKGTVETSVKSIRTTEGTDTEDAEDTTVTEDDGQDADKGQTSPDETGEQDNNAGTDGEQGETADNADTFPLQESDSGSDSESSLEEPAEEQDENTGDSDGDEHDADITPDSGEPASDNADDENADGEDDSNNEGSGESNASNEETTDETDNSNMEDADKADDFDKEDADESDGSDDIDSESTSVSEDADSKISSRNTFRKAFSMFSLLGSN